MPRPAVRARALRLAYGGQVVLRDADLDLPTGALTVLMGPNGSGKSTLLHACAGLLAPAAGSLDVAEPRPAVVLQATEVPRTLPLTVSEAVRMGRWRGPLRRLDADDRAAVHEAMVRLDLVDLARRQVRELSGGQRQRVFVAQALAQGSDLLLLDEPFTGLDLVSRQRIDEVVDAERAAGRTVVASTHELGDAARADHVVLLAGRIVATGSPREVLVTEHLTAAYGGRLLRVEEGLLLFDDPHHGSAPAR